MKTIFQDIEGEIREIDGQVCETLLCVQVANEESIALGVFWMKVLNGDWHRFFLDAEYYGLVWTIHNELDSSDLEDEDYPVIDIGERYKLNNRRISEINMKQIREDGKQIGCLTIFFSEDRMIEWKQGSETSSLAIY